MTSNIFNERTMTLEANVIFHVLRSVLLLENAQEPY